LITPYMIHSKASLVYFEIRNMGSKRDPTPSTNSKNHPTIPACAWHDKSYKESCANKSIVRLNNSNIPQNVGTSHQHDTVSTKMSWIFSVLLLPTLHARLIT